MRKNYYVLITERDSHEPFDNGGSIIHEQYVADCDLDKVCERAKKFSKYGRTFLGKITEITEIDENFKPF